MRIHKTGSFVLPISNICFTNKQHLFRDVLS